ncbi:hypothetical protein Tasa_031_066 [Tanticharoenia sakaeratensis NBRC 103193]|uniref:YggT family protein n=1 Tax=Tanticharoenia sakaeratensis NBRC 103193 TaxID=1231623 RepID=A0A0D6MNJ0_9PROT|nr:hypothetical protein Tasa_031_066 [Tanticharoenia sakaeratensis NBRC 103193]GBQ21378.1 hypothetical protein AA103193_1707 [Tanticharoenia sakaeratensis NBRC 103193]
MARSARATALLAPPEVISLLLIIVYQIVIRLIQIYTYVVIASCVFSMLFAFGVLDPRNRFVYEIGVFLNRVTEPVLGPIRRILPTVGNIDFSPLALLLILQYLAVPLITQIFIAVASLGHA